MSFDISVVIPAYNESETISQLHTALSGYVASIDFRIQFVFVDDGSQDDTIDKLLALEIKGAAIKIVKLSRNYGSHAAIRAGVANADADYVMIYSMDMPEPVQDIGLIRDKLLEGNEIVYSERIGYKGSLGSRIFAKMINLFIEEAYPSKGLIGVGFGSKVKRELNNNIENSSSVFFQIFQLGFKKLGIPVVFCEREQGESKWTLRKKVKLLVDSFVMFSFAPIRVISILGVFLALIGLIWALAIIVIKLFDLFELAAGWPTTISVLLIGFGITNLSLGIIAEYLSRTLEAARHRPVFIVDDVFDKDSS